MENASKALIIAGAILLSILIIALGVFVFNQARSAMGNINMSEQEIAAFNSKFENYAGDQKGSSVKSLISTLRNYNNTIDTSAAEYIDLKNGEATNNKVNFVDTLPSYPSNIKAGTMYVISFDYNQAGQISAIYYKERP